MVWFSILIWDCELWIRFLFDLMLWSEILTSYCDFDLIFGFDLRFWAPISILVWFMVVIWFRLCDLIFWLLSCYIWFCLINSCDLRFWADISTCFDLKFRSGLWLCFRFLFDLGFFDLHFSVFLGFAVFQFTVLIWFLNVWFLNFDFWLLEKNLSIWLILTSWTFFLVFTMFIGSLTWINTSSMISIHLPNIPTHWNWTLNYKCFPPNKATKGTKNRGCTYIKKETN